MKFASGTLISLSILLVLLIAGAVIRFHHIDRESLWLDEYWSVYISTGRGDAVFDVPHGVLLNRPPNIGFDQAPSIWHVWTGLANAVHPPFYFLALRAWIDLFSDLDFSTRALSAFCSLAAIAVMFDTVRRARGSFSGILAAGMMTFSAAQIDFSQEIRQYSMLVLLGILCCAAMLAIQRHGATRWRLTGLAASVGLLALTHYLAAGAILGVGCFALLVLRGHDRRATIATMATTLLIVAAAWGPQFLRAMGSFRGATLFAPEGQITGIGDIANSLLIAAHRLVLGSDSNLNLPLAIALSILAVLPLALYRRGQPDALLWSLWVAGSLGFMLVADIHAMHQRPPLLSRIRYIMIASVGLYPLLATPLPAMSRLGKLRWAGPVAVAVAAMFFGIERYQIGPAHKIDWKSLVAGMHGSVGPRDVLVFGPHQVLAFAPSSGYFAVYTFMAFRHYAPQAKNPVVILSDPATPQLLEQLAQFDRVWLVGDKTTPVDLLPGWQRGPGPGNEDLQVWSVSPPVAAASTASTR